jgi:hypothetical protein
MTVSVRIPTTLRTLTGGQSQVSLEGANVRDVLASLDGAHPGFADRPAGRRRQPAPLRERLRGG